MTALIDQGSSGFSQMQAEVEKTGQAAALSEAQDEGVSAAALNICTAALKVS